MKKTCTKCHEEKDLDQFVIGKNYKSGRRSTCKKCQSNYMVNYYKSNPDKIEEKRRLNNYYRPAWLRHNLTSDRHSELFSLYEGKCHACRVNSAAYVDHDHKCCSGNWSCGNCVRGILCRPCNTALGFMQDNVDYLNNLIHYLSQ